MKVLNQHLYFKLEVGSKMRKCFLISLLFFVALIRPVWCNHVISEATLHITLYVPPKPAEEETEPGDYGEYTVSKDEETIYVEAK